MPKTITIVLIIAATILLILLATAPCSCERDHYANQVVHAGVGSIAGPIVQIDERPYVPPEHYQSEEQEDAPGIVGKF